MGDWGWSGGGGCAGIKSNVSLTFVLTTWFLASVYTYLIPMVSCQKGLIRHAYAWQIGPFWQDTLDTCFLFIPTQHPSASNGSLFPCDSITWLCKQMPHAFRVCWWFCVCTKSRILWKFTMLLRRISWCLVIIEYLATMKWFGRGHIFLTFRYIIYKNCVCINGKWYSFQANE